MLAEDGLSTAVRERLLATFDEMRTILLAVEERAGSRGYAETWWGVVSEMMMLRRSLEFAPLAADFAQAMDALAARYDQFIGVVIPNPTEH